MKNRIKKNDTVVVLSGKDRGKKGKVLEIFPEKNLVIVEGVNIATIHRRARRQGEESKIVRQETCIHISNVLPIDAATGSPKRASTIKAS